MLDILEQQRELLDGSRAPVESSGGMAGGGL